MPLARIITSSADDSLELTMQLRSRGFHVETVAPDYISEIPADVEVRLEECSSEDVLSKAAVGKDGDDLWVFVAPGALDEGARPIRTISLIPPREDRVAPWPAESLKAVLSTVPPRTDVASSFPLPDDPILAHLKVRHSPASPDQVPNSDGNTSKGEVPSAIAMSPTTAAATSRKSAEPVRAPVPAKAAAPKRAEIPEIPKVPARPEPQIMAPLPQAKPARTRSYNIAFRIVPGFWRTASVAFALVVLAGVLTAIMVVRPRLLSKKPSDGVTAQPALIVPLQPIPREVKPPVEAVAVPAKKTPAASAQPVGRDASERSRRRRSASDEGIIAEDTVKFYDRPGMKATRREPPQPDLKHYSDSN